jgi:hypothetical protein
LGGKWRVGLGGPVSGLTRARAVVWWLGDCDEGAAEEKLDGGSAQALREGKKRRGGCGENRWRHLPFIGAIRR